MFFKRTLFLVAVLAVTNAAQIQPTGLVDEALEQLEELKAIVQGEIIVAHDNLNQIEVAFGTNSVNVINNGAIALEQEHDAVIAEVQSLKDLAHSASVDPSSCTEIREQTLNRLPQRYTQEISTCVADLISATKIITENSKYMVDITFSTVRSLEYQINRCKEELLCISPILNEIELDKIRLPQNIKTEVQACESTTNTLKLSVQSCSDDKVAQYGTEAYTIVGDIEACINRLLQ